MNNQPAPLHVPNPVRSRRAASGLPVRIAYAAGLLGLGLYLAWYFGRAVLFLEGGGIVSAPLYVVSTPYLSQVVHMNVAPGVEVEKGDLLANLKSPELEREINDLDRVLVEQSQREAELRIRLRIANATLSAAADRVAVAEEAFHRLETESGKATSLGYRMDVYRERSLAGIQRAEAEAEADETRRQLIRFDDNRRRIQAKIDALRQAFDDGRLGAPIEGLVGNRLAHSGEVIKPGDAVVEIYDLSETHIVWHIPAFSLREPAVADLVYVQYGSRVLPGYVAEIKLIAETASDPDQSILRERQQRQVVLVKLAKPDSTMPMGAQVLVRMNYSGTLDSLVTSALELFR